MHRPIRLRCDKNALAANYRWLASMTTAAAGAAIKADGYGLGAQETLELLAGQGCRDFFVSTWWEAEQLGGLPHDVDVAVLHGVGPEDVVASQRSVARPVLNTPEQVARWREIAGDRPCDVMVDTGMNRLGLRLDELACVDGLYIRTLHSHLACADEDHPLNATQVQRFREASAQVRAERYSLANSAGILLGADYHFDLVRPGLALYGGVPRPEAEGSLKQVAFLEAQVVQRRTIRAGETSGYSATFRADRDTEAAVINIGYADGYWRGFSSSGTARVDDVTLPVLGRVSMDLVVLGCEGAKDLREGDWVTLDFILPEAARRSGMSQYELLTGLGHRFVRLWS